VTVQWIGEPVTWLGVTVDADPNEMTSVTCYNACWHACNETLNISPIPDAPAGPLLLVEICAAKCYDDSGCEALPGDVPIVEYDEYDSSVPPAPPSPGVPRAPSKLSFPWGTVATETKSLQKSLNKKLIKDGYCAIAEDGKLGARTCGSAQHYGAAPPTCQAFTAPKKCAPGVQPAPTEPSPALVAASTPRGRGAGAVILVLGGLALAGLAIAGASR